MNEQDVNKLGSQCIDELRNFFKQPMEVKETKTALNVARMAQSTFAAIGRWMATNRATEAMQLVIIKEIAKNKDEFKKHIKSTMPHFDPEKGLLSKPKK